ncbi:Retinoic acid induced 16-like protein-domain-containing protein [Colletotrichum cereale]|nr:Retinoic acid induced 16-like protein-domain-containing protein [Colletotrichum cereale]
MDFWSRLLAGTSLSPSAHRKEEAKNPTKRLHRFDKEYNRILQVWRSSSNLANDVDAAENLEVRLQELTNILTDESRRPLPHPCIQYAAKKQVYVPIGKIATTSYNEWIIKEAVLFFATLLETEEEAFVENTTFSASLTNLLVRITGVNSVRLGSDTEARVVELAFNITTKIRLNRDILHAWFRSHHDGNHQDRPHDDHNAFAGRTQRLDFPLFYILMDYIHHEGKVGDFARTGLLYIIESASSDESLEQWIVESDLSTLMATGLGALYSQLSRKLVIDYPSNDLPPVLALSDYQHPTSTFEIISSCSPDFQLHLETFLSHLLFWQDVLDHCKSVEVKQTLLEHFQVIFLQQLLYPSLLESSDIDGGSSVAVLTYLRRILESLDHPDMINLILHYLLGLPEHTSPDTTGSRASISAARKRKSLDLATMLAQTKSDITATPLLFNLVDLVQACLRSHNQQTIRVTLQLVSAILRRHHRYAVSTLLRTEVVLGDNMHRTVGAHEQEVDYLMSLAGSIGGQDNFDEIYDNILKDTMSRLESHPCSLKLVAPKTSTNNHDLPAVPDTLPGAPRDVRGHTLRPDDPLLNSVLDLLETFFINPVDTNLSLTEALLDLAICGYVTPEGWMMRNPHKYTYEEQPPSPMSPDASATSFRPPTDPDSTTSAEQQTLESLDACRRRPIWTQSSLPRILVVLQRLCSQVASYRETIPRFEDLLQGRREAFQTADNPRPPPPLPARKLTPQRHSSAHTPERSSLDEATRSGSPARPSGLERFAQRLVSELSTPSRAGSPRGRKNSRGTGTASPGQSSMSGGYGFSTPTSRPVPPPKDTPASHDTLGRSATDETGSLHTPRDPVASQAAAFAAIDQSILARKIGIPDKVEAIPLDLGRRKPTLHMPPPKDEEAAEDQQEDGGPEAEEQTDDVEAEPIGGDTVEGNTPKRENGKQERKASVSHVITNVIVLQSFLFELAALFQARAALFNEVRYA